MNRLRSFLLGFWLVAAAFLVICAAGRVLRDDGLSMAVFDLLGAVAAASNFFRVLGKKHQEPHNVSDDPEVHGHEKAKGQGGDRALQQGRHSGQPYHAGRYE